MKLDAARPLLLIACIATGTLLSAAEKKDPKAPNVDLNRIVNTSYNFLKNREPEMTGVEHALYERVVSMTNARPDFALKMLETMLADKEEESPAFEFVLGNLYYTNKQFDLSEQRYRSAVNKYPEYLRAWTNLGVLYYATQRYTEAIACFNKAVELGDRESSTLGLLAYSLDKTGNSIAAEVCYMQAMAADPANPDWIGGLMSIYLASQQYGPAESLVRRLIAEKPSDANHWLVYANIKIALEKRLEAIAVLETALQVGAQDPDAILLLADLYAEQRMFPEALTTYQLGMKASPNLGVTRTLTYAQALIGEGEYKNAAKILDTIPEQSHPTSLTSKKVRAELQLAQNDWKAARQTLEEIIERAPLDGEALLSLARVYREENEVARAEFALEQAVHVETTAYRALVELANLAVKNRNYSIAVTHLQRALQLQRSPTLEDYLTRIRALLPKDAPATQSVPESA